MCKKSKAILIQVVLSITGILMALIFSEILIRVLEKYSINIRFYSTSPYKQQYLANVFNWKDLANIYCCQYPGMKFNDFIFNSHGFENPETTYQKPNGTRRLVLIGDSQTVGYVPYNDNFGRLIEKKINKSLSNFEVVNLGVLGIGPLMELKLLEVEGIKYQPDIVMLSFFIGNDFYDDLIYSQKYYQTISNSPSWIYQSRLLGLLQNMYRFKINNNLKSALNNEAARKIGTEIGKYNYDESSPTFSKEQYLYLESQRAEVLVKSNNLYGQLDSIKKSIMSMKLLADRSNAKFIVLIIPDEFQINSTLFSEIINKKTTSENTTKDMANFLLKTEVKEKERDWSKTDYDIEFPQRILKEELTKNNIQFVDLLESWKYNVEEASYYLPQNTHLNRIGNMAIADIVTPIILDMLKK